MCLVILCSFFPQKLPFFHVSPRFSYPTLVFIRAPSTASGALGASINAGGGKALGSSEKVKRGRLAGGSCEKRHLGDFDHRDSAGRHVYIIYMYLCMCTYIYIYYANTGLITPPQKVGGVPSDWFSWPPLNKATLNHKKLDMAWVNGIHYPQPFWLVFSTAGWVNHRFLWGKNLDKKKGISEPAAILARFHHSWLGKPTDSYGEEF